MSKFSERLKYLRKEQKITQQELADRIGMSKSSVNMYERGEREPSLEMLETIADYFNVDLDYLLGKSDIANRAKQALEPTGKDTSQQLQYPIAASDEYGDTFGIDQREKEIVEKFRMLDEHGKHLVETITNTEYERCSSDTQEVITAARNGKSTVLKLTKRPGAGSIFDQEDYKV